MFSSQLHHTHIQDRVSQSLQTPSSAVIRCLKQPTFSSKDLSILLSPAAEPYLETMAQKSSQLTRQHFGRTMQLFIPLYLSNECYNSCTYCGFSFEHKYPRTTLSDSDIIAEAKTLAAKGFKHVLLLTGESPKKVGVDYIAHAIKLVKPFFASIGIEVQPLKKTDYKTLIKAGAQSLTLYQETYHKASYKQYHTFGIKRRFNHRLNALEEGAKAGFFTLNIGTLMGLYQWQYESFALADHLDYLKKTYWKCHYALSFPRIQDMIGSFKVAYPLSDCNLVQLITAFRLIYPKLGITLSTREPAQLRNNLVSLGITSMSAESKTAPGSYSGCGTDEQFSISDTRSISDIQDMLATKNLDAVAKDWDMSLNECM